MGLYLRKSFRAGPIRLNLSKSGLGLSGGIKGGRVALGPRGPYVHAGRYGLYYRNHLSSTRSRARSEEGGTGCATLVLVIAGVGLTVWLFNWLLSNPMVFATGVALIAIVSLLPWSIRLRRKRLIAAYKKALDAAFVTGQSPPTHATVSALAQQQRRLPQNDAAKKEIHKIESDAYQAVLDKVLDDGFVTKEEAASITAAEQTLRLSPATCLMTKKEIFSAAYLEAIQDRVLTNDELSKLRNLLEGLGIPKSEVQRELDIVHEIIKTQALRLPFKPKPREQLPIPIQKSEDDFYSCPAQILSRRKSKDSPSGFEYTVRRDGTLVLTNKRVFVVGAGTTTISYADIADLDVDIDDGLIEISKVGSRRPIFLKTSHPIYTGRAIELLMSAHQEEGVE